jgi:RNA polymerase sigma factor (sigma-70 family)
MVQGMPAPRPTGVIAMQPHVPAYDLERLVAAAAAGDQPSWDALVERFGPALIRMARSHGLSRHEAEDAVQETWMRLLRRIETVREPRALSGWLRTTVRHESLRVRDRRQRESPTADELCADVADATTLEAESELDAAECGAAVARALDALPARHRRLMRALFTETEPSYEEVASQLGIPVGSIGPIRRRCLARLRLDGRLRRVAEALD